MLNGATPMPCSASNSDSSCVAWRAGDCDESSEAFWQGVLNGYVEGDVLILPGSKDWIAIQMGGSHVLIRKSCESWQCLNRMAVLCVVHVWAATLRYTGWLHCCQQACNQLLFLLCRCENPRQHL